MLNIVLCFFLGSALGSAALCFMERDSKKSWLTGRSACPVCKHTLQWYELVPVISYLIQKGCCRKCKSHIPVYTVLMEVYGGLAGMMFYYNLLNTTLPNSIFLLCAIGGYIALAKYLVGLHAKTMIKKQGPAEDTQNE